MVSMLECTKQMAQGGRNEDCNLNVDKLLVEIQEKLKNMGQQERSYTIFKVPEQIYQSDPAQYKPIVVSIGPYHKDSTPEMDNEKLACLEAVRSGGFQQDLRQYLVAMEALETQARGYYQHNVEMSNEEFVLMLLLDGCYLLYALYGFDGVGGYPSSVAKGPASDDSPTQKRSLTIPRPSQLQENFEDTAILRDIFLIENQIPFKVVEKICILATGNSDAVAGNIAAYLRAARLHRYSKHATDKISLKNVDHLLHLCHLHFRPNELHHRCPNNAGVRVGRWRRATQYKEAGVRLKSTELYDGSILDVTVSNGSVLKVPRLEIDAHTFSLLRNLMALEQAKPQDGSYVTAYCVFLSQIACTVEDVALLSKKGIIVHMMGSDQELVNRLIKLCDGLVFDANDGRSNYLKLTYLALEKRYHSRTSKFLSLLCHKH